jgi:hypothetical protein
MDRRQMIGLTLLASLGVFTALPQKPEAEKSALQFDRGTLLRALASERTSSFSFQG